jgi:hypothetical protein
MTEQKLNLLKLPAGFVTQSSACAPDMPYAACPALCRVPDYAESDSKTAGWRALPLFFNIADSA